MNRKIAFFSAVLLFAFFSGCNEEQPAVKDSGEWINIIQQNVIISQKESYAYFNIHSNAKWMISCKDTWLTFSHSSGEGNDLIRISAIANNMIDDRETTVTVTSEEGIIKMVMVLQDGTGPPIFEILPDMGLVGGNIIFTGSKLDLIDELWIGDRQGTIVAQTYHAMTVTLPGTTEGSAEMKIVCSDGSEIMIGTIVISPPSLDVDMQELSFAGEGGSDYFNITTNVGWTVTCTDWITCDPLSGESSRTISVSVPANSSSKARNNGVITVTMEGGSTIKEIQVTQDGRIPLVNALPEAPIGSSIAFSGSNLDMITEVWFGAQKGTISAERTDVLMPVTIPETASEGEVVLKVVYPDDESIVGTIYLYDKDAQINVNLAHYAGSLISDVAVLCGSQLATIPSPLPTGGQLAIFAFDEVNATADHDRVDYAVIYGPDKVPARARTYWQTAGSGVAFGEIPNGQAAPTGVPGHAWLALDYSATTKGYVTFDKIVLHPYPTPNVTKYTIEVSDDNLNWTKVVRAEETQTLNGPTVAVTHQLTELVTAKYVRFVVVQKDTGNTGLTELRLYRTKIR